MITFLAFSYCDGIITNKFTITPSITVIFEQREFVTMTEISERFLWQSQYYEIYKSYIVVFHFVSFIEVVVWYQIVVGEASIVMSPIGCYNNFPIISFLLENNLLILLVKHHALESFLMSEHVSTNAVLQNSTPDGKNLRH